MTFALIVTIFSILIINVFVVSVGGYHFNSGTNIKEVVKDIHTVYEPIIAKRGKILDYQDSVLVEDNKAFTVHAYIADDRFDGDKPAYVVDKETAATQIASVLNISSDFVLERLNSDAKQVEFGVDGKRITTAQKDALDAFNIPGLGFTEVLVRAQYSSSLGSTLIGLTRFDETEEKQVGIMGVESYYNDVLNGKNGVSVYRQDVEQLRYDTIDSLTVEAEDGKDIKLSIDKIVQSSLDKALNNIMQAENVKAQEAWGALVDVKTGRILALADAPSFNANDPDTVYMNRATEYQYEPGSTMKTLMYAMALNDGVITPDQIFNGNAFYLETDPNTGKGKRVSTSSGRTETINNPFKSNYGNITMKEGYQRSSNVMIAEVLTNYLDTERFRQYMLDLGFFTPVKVGKLPEAEGYELWDYFHEKVTNGFGQGSTVTMMQLLQAHTAVFGDGTVVKPYIVESIINPNTGEVEYQAEVTKGKKVFTEEAVQLTRDAMHENVDQRRYGMQRFKMDDISVMAKSGTSEIVIDGKYSNKDFIFSAMLGFPYENPQYAFYFAYKTYDGHSNTFVANEMKNVIKTVVTNYPINLTDDDEEVVTPVHKIVMPNYVNQDINSVRGKLSELGYTPVIIGDGDVVIEQYPKRKTDVLNNEKIFLNTNSTDKKIPDMSGWSLKEVMDLSNFMKLEISIEGHGFVKSQSLAPNSPIGDGTGISVILE